MLFYPLLGTFFFSGSMSLARATPLFLEVTGFRGCSTFSVPIPIGMVSYAETKQSPNERVFVSKVQSHALARLAQTW